MNQQVPLVAADTLTLLIPDIYQVPRRNADAEAIQGAFRSLRWLQIPSDAYLQLDKMAWGHQAKGLGPTALRSAKAGIAKASGCHRQGGCTTTAIALQCSPAQDPEVSFRIELILTWMEV